MKSQNIKLLLSLVFCLVTFFGYLIVLIPQAEAKPKVYVKVRNYYTGAYLPLDGQPRPQIVWASRKQDDRAPLASYCNWDSPTCSCSAYSTVLAGLGTSPDPSHPLSDGNWWCVRYSLSLNKTINPWMWNLTLPQTNAAWMDWLAADKMVYFHNTNSWDGFGCSEKFQFVTAITDVNYPGTFSRVMIDNLYNCPLNPTDPNCKDNSDYQIFTPDIIYTPLIPLATPTPTPTSTPTPTPTPTLTPTPTARPWLKTTGGDVHSNK